MMPNILIVEDSRFIRFLLRKNLEHLEMNIVGECTHSKHVLELYKQTLPDVVLIDHSLPDLSGLQLTETLLAHDIYARIILMIPQRMAKESQNIIAIGVKAVVIKPFYPENLQSTLIEVAMG